MRIKRYGNKIRKKLFNIGRLEIYWIVYHYPRPYTRLVSVKTIPSFKLKKTLNTDSNALKQRD